MTETPPPRTQSLIALVVAATFFMENLDGTVIATALPAIAASFKVRPLDLNIGMSAYLLTLGAFIPASGWLAERLGGRRVFAAAIVIFTVASALCGLSTSLGPFIAMRVLQGIGGAMMVPVGRLIVLQKTPKDRLITAIATLTWPALVAPILGPPVGGFIVEHASWRWIFYLNLPIGVVALLGVMILVPKGMAHKGRPFDAIGFALTSFGIALCVLGLDMLGQRSADGTLVGPILAGGTASLAAALFHFRRTDHPLLDFAGLRVPTFAVSVWGGSLFRMSVGAVPFLLPLLFQTGFGYSPFRAGLLMIAVFAGNLAMKPATTPILRQFGFRRVLIGNGICNALALGLCGTLSASTPLAIVVGLLFVGGMFRSMQFTALNTVAFADVALPAMNAANTLFATAMQLTIGLGIALAALALRVGEILAGAGGPSFRIAFLVIGAVALLGVVDALMLPEDAGADLARRRS
jgi:EmrB/QacA subfamily drug resistance transporter